jgi:hypothetical protein
MGNAHADYKFNLSGPFFSVTDCVSLLCSAATSFSVNSTTYGKSRDSNASYGAPFYSAAGWILVVISHYYDWAHTHAHTHTHVQSLKPVLLGQTSYT